jgi:hypothetical protein
VQTPPEQQPLPYPLLRIMVGNAFLLSVIYLVVGIAVELARRFYPTKFVARLSLSLDSLPAQALELTGLMEPLKTAYSNGELPDYQVRLIFGATTIVIIFLLAFAVGLLVGGLRSYIERRALRKYRQGRSG